MFVHCAVIASLLLSWLCAGGSAGVAWGHENLGRLLLHAWVAEQVGAALSHVYPASALVSFAMNLVDMALRREGRAWWLNFIHVEAFMWQLSQFSCCLCTCPSMRSQR